MNTDLRAQNIATLRALADLLERDPSIPLPYTRITWWPAAKPVIKALMQAVPLPWKTAERHLGERDATLTAETAAERASERLLVRLVVFPELAGGGVQETRTVTRWVPDPEIAALMGNGGEAA